MKRDYQVKVRLTREEFDSLNRDVSRTRLSKEEFCRQAFKGAEIRQAPPTEILRIFRLMADVRTQLEDIHSAYIHYGIFDKAKYSTQIDKLTYAQWLLGEVYLMENN